MDASKRVTLIQDVSDRLRTDSWVDIDLVLRQFGFPTTDQWDSQDQYGYCIHHIGQGNDDDIISLHRHLLGETDLRDGSNIREGPWEEDCFRVFLSHVSSEKQFVSGLKTCLRKYAIDAFVAHEDIEPTEEWLVQIELALSTCDALVAVLTDKFHQSKWTDQEIGFCVARRVLIVPIRLGQDPYGFISRYQALSPGRSDASALGENLASIFASQELTAGAMAQALVRRFVYSDSFATAKENVRLLDLVTTWTPKLLGEIRDAPRENPQIRNAYGVPELVKRILVDQAEQS